MNNKLYYIDLNNFFCFRILPSLFSIILICTYLLPFMGSGPLWPLVINHHAELCKKYMYRNILFIHNYLGFDNMVSFKFNNLQWYFF